MSKAIQDFNIGYAICKQVTNFATYCHYNRFVINGKENIPNGNPFIIAPCHQNALMEPMAVLTSLRGRIVFLARADIFENPTLRSILTFLRIMPVYRIRDGKDNLGRNAEIFEKSKGVLLDRIPLCLMAEGRHNDKHQLLPLVKGMFRIAGETQRALDSTPLYIVPTGIDFDEYEQPYSNLVVNYGKPIKVSQFMNTYSTNEPLALNQMREALSESLRQQMHEITSRKYYEEIATVCDVANPQVRRTFQWSDNAYNRFTARQHIAQRLDRQVKTEDPEEPDFVKSAQEYMQICDRLHIGRKTAAEHWPLWMIVSSTVAALALISVVVGNTALWHGLLFMLVCNPIAVIPTHLIVRRTVKDPQFRSSINFGVRTLLTLLYAIVCATVLAVCHGWIWAPIALLSAAAVARLCAPIYTTARLWLANIRWLRLTFTHPTETDRLIHLQKILSASIG